MKSYSRDDTDNASQQLRIEPHEAVKTEERHEKMERQREEAPSDHITDIVVVGEIADILNETETDAHEWAHSRRESIREGLKPFPYLLMVWSPKQRSRR